MNRGTGLFGAAAAGATLMYLFDPDRGRRRRSVARDKLVSGAHQFGDAVELTARDLANRTRGQGARLRSLLTLRASSDHEIGEAVRSEIGFVVRHPGAIDARVDDGRVVLTGPILDDEVDRLLSVVSAIRGVRDVENHLRVHREPGDIPGLQGEPARRRGRALLPWSNRVWSPAERLGAGLVGGAVALWGVRRGGVSGGLSGTAGLALLLRGITNTELSRLTGIGAGRQAVTVQKTLTVRAPIEEVFAFWSHPENFPRAMSHVRQVRPAAEGHWHWVVTGPAGLPIEFDTELSAHVPHDVLGWRTVPGALVAHSGIIRFQAADSGTTRVHIRMSYNPPAGAIGHAVAAFFGSDPKHAMDEDLVRFKSLIEQGKTRAEELGF